MSIKSLLLGSAMLSALSPSVSAQTAQDDEIIITALRAIPASDITSSVTVLDGAALDIRNSPYIADQLRAVPGVAVSRSGALGGLTQIRMRGAEANHTLVLVNGVEVSDPTTGETDFGLWSGLNVTRIEAARGEQSVLYGSDAIGGVIAIETGGDSLQGAIEYGSRDTLRGSLGYAGESDAGSFGVSVSGYQTDGVDTSGLGGEKDGFDAISLMAQGGVKLTDDWSANGFASLRRSSVQSDPDTNFDGALDNADREGEIDQSLIGVAVTGLTGQLSHLLRASYSDVVSSNSADGVFTNRTTGERMKLSYSPSATFGADGASVTLSAIADYEDEDYQREDTNTAFGDPNQSQSFETFGYGAEARASLGDIALNASVRRDDNDGRFEDATTWRIGGAYNFGYGGKLRASAGAAVKNPTFTELFGFFPGSFVGNSNLVPEKSQSWEVGYDYASGPFAASVTYFDAELENEIFTAFNSDFTSTAANRDGDSARSGVEIGASAELPGSLTLAASVTKISSENDSGEDEIRVPKLTGSVAVNWQSTSLEGFRIGAALDYVGSQDDFNFGTFPAARVELDSYILASATAEYPIAERIWLTLRGENLFDEETTDVFGFNGPGAAILAGFKLR